MPADPSHGKTFNASDLAPVSGIYRAIHLTQHRKPHLVVIIRGEELPHCRTCGGEVRFEIVHMASHVTHDWDFPAPAGLVVRQSPSEFANLRSFPRHQVALKVEVDRPEHDPVQGHTTDVSDGGICAVLDSKLPADDPLVSLRIDVPGAAAPLSARALMRYRAGNRHGFLFTDLDVGTREMVRSMVAGARRVHPDYAP